jgi:phage/plasmid-associated DNA primase
MIFSNELLKLVDASAAIISRLVLLRTTKSWLGREDHALQGKLEKELPGILNRALAGLRRLNANGGKFTHVESTEAALRDLEALASPVMAFVWEIGELGAEYQEDTGVLYRLHRSWCMANGHAVPSSAVFGRNLMAAFPEITKRRPRTTETTESAAPRAALALQAVAGWEGVKTDESRKYVYAGIRIAREAQASQTAGGVADNDNVRPFRGSAKTGA